MQLLKQKSKLYRLLTVNESLLKQTWLLESCLVNWQFLYFTDSENFIQNLWNTSNCGWLLNLVTTGCPTKHDPHGGCLISLATNIVESWSIIHWKDGILSFIWSTKTFLYDIWESRYKQIKMGDQISKCLDIGQS